MPMPLERALCPGGGPYQPGGFTAVQDKKASQETFNLWPVAISLSSCWETSISWKEFFLFLGSAEVIHSQRFVSAIGESVHLCVKILHVLKFWVQRTSQGNRVGRKSVLAEVMRVNCQSNLCPWTSSLFHHLPVFPLFPQQSHLQHCGWPVSAWRLQCWDSWPLQEAAEFQYVLPYVLTLLHFFHLFMGNLKEFNGLF